MSIDVKISLSRKSAVFLTGEQFTVQISLANTHPSQVRSLAWGCVQLHCEESAQNDRRLNGHSAPATTAFARSKQAIFSSEPAILFCDIHLEPGAVQHFEAQKQIPLDLPPTFKGRFAKYLWCVSVAAQQVDAPIKMVQLPIKVLNVGVDVSTASGDSRQEEPAVGGAGTNPFMRRDLKSPSIVEVAMNRIEELCSVRKQRFYGIKSGGAMFATVVLFKNMFKLGDDVVGKFEFPQEEVKCLQTLVRAEVVETNLRDEKGAESVQAQNTEHMITAFARETHFKLQLPMSAVPSFTTESVKVRWRLRFEFVTTTQKVLDQQGPTEVGAVSRLATDLDIQTMKWDLPISVLTSNPFNAGLICLQPSTTSFSI